MAGEVEEEERRRERDGRRDIVGKDRGGRDAVGKKDGKGQMSSVRRMEKKRETERDGARETRKGFSYKLWKVGLGCRFHSGPSTADRFEMGALSMLLARGSR